MSPDRRRHRGAHPEDSELFSAPRLPALRTAVTEMSWLLSRGYAPRSALKLVGDRHGLRDRQRTAVGRASCSDAARERRAAHRATCDHLAGGDLVIDALNVIVSLEAAMAGGVILWCRDSAFRDLASVHGSYRRVEETRVALELIGEELSSATPAHVRWLIDRPVSNSGRLARIIEAEAARRHVTWAVDLVDDPDPIMKASEHVVASSDSAVLDSCGRWLGLTRHLIDRYIPDAWIVDLRPAPDTN